MTLALEFAPTAQFKYRASLSFPNSSTCTDGPFDIPLAGQGLVDAVYNTSSGNIRYFRITQIPSWQKHPLNIQLHEKQEIRLTLNDMNGRVIKTITTGKISEGKHLVHLNLSELPSGTYFLLLESGITKSMRELTLAK